MILSDNVKRILLYSFVILSLLTTAYHLTGIFYKINDSPVWRHAIFVVVGLFCAYGFLSRPKYFEYIFGLLIVQQYFSHGSRLIKTWTLEHHIHWISLFVIVILPLGLIYLLIDKKEDKLKTKNKNGL